MKAGATPCSQAGEKEVDDLVVEVEDWLPELAAAIIAERIERRGLDFTAVLTAGDSLAYGVDDRGLRTEGHFRSRRRIGDRHGRPAAIGVFSSPPLSAMHIPMREMGSEALSLLLDHLSGGPMLPRRVELACRLVVRQSTAKAKG
jgi:DNA-binding LacI/PurR family transcriptional regulator